MHTQITTDALCHTGYNGYNNNNAYNCESDLINGQREIVKSIYDSENDVRTHLDASTNSILNGQTQISQGVNHVSRDVLNTQHNLSKEIGDNRFFTSNGFSDIRRELSGVNNDLNKSLFNVEKSVNSNLFTLLLEQQKGFASTQLDACKNTSELAKKIDECCCETQKAILAQSASIRELDLKQASQTRELALTIENNRLRDKCDNNERHSRNGDIEIAITNVLRNFNIKS